MVFVRACTARIRRRARAAAVTVHAASGKRADAIKVFLFASMMAAAAFGALYGAPGWRRFPLICAAAFFAALLLGRIGRDVPLIVALGSLYLAPALISMLHGAYYWNFQPVWFAWTLGALLARPV